MNDPTDDTTATVASVKNRKRRRPPRLDKDNAHIVIVGCGLAGLSVGVALCQAGYQRVEIYERDTSLEQQREGYGLTLSYNRKGPLAALQILERIAQQDCPSRSHYVFHALTGIPLGYFGNAFVPSSRGGQRGNLRVPRKVVRRILYDTFLELQQHKRQQQQQQQHQEGQQYSTEPSKSPNVYWNHQLIDFDWKPASSNDNDDDDSNVESKFQYHLKFETSSSSSSSATTTTTQIVNVKADLLIAADGIRSSVLQKLYSTIKQSRGPPPSIYTHPEYYGLRSMGVRLILGIADDIYHPLLKERGFYSLDGKHRLFTMPYQSNRFDLDNKKCNRIMWQLSFSTHHTNGTSIDGDSNSRQQQVSSSLDPISLRQYVLDTCQSWHEPVLDLIHSTPLESIWGTDLMDRNPRQVHQDLIVQQTQKRQPRRLVIVGDALHSMSPFKGQGANQALADGPLLAHWLQNASIDAAINGWWRETLDRTAPIVEASRKAAQILHSVKAVDEHASKEHYGFAGVQIQSIPNFIQILEREKIGASLGKRLDRKIYHILEQHNWFDTLSVTLTRTKNCKDVDNHDENITREHQQQQALAYAETGNTQELRQMSLDKKKCLSILTAVDEEGRSCLHLATMNNHLTTCYWLLVELQCSRTLEDVHGKTSYDYALQTKNEHLTHMFHVIMKEEEAEVEKKKKKYETH